MAECTDREISKWVSRKLKSLKKEATINDLAVWLDVNKRTLESWLYQKKPSSMKRWKMTEIFAVIEFLSIKSEVAPINLLIELSYQTNEFCVLSSDHARRVVDG